MTEYYLQFDLRSILVGDNSFLFLLETLLRTIVMFCVILFSLRLLGKRGIKQLSVFELGVIIGLGSAAGDPMFYKEVGLLTGIAVFVAVLALYKLVTYLINHNEKFEKFVEGDPVCILKDGKLLPENFRKESIALEELFMQLRLGNVSQLGQVEQAILETNGEVSIFYYPDKEVVYGLPIIPSVSDQKQKSILTKGLYSCASCGFTQTLEASPACICEKCRKTEWVKSVNDKRIS